MADVGRNGREGVATLAICLIETSPPRRSSRRTRVRACVRAEFPCSSIRTKEEEDTSGEQYMPRLYYIRGGRRPRAHPRAYTWWPPFVSQIVSAHVFRRHICDWIRAR